MTTFLRLLNESNKQKALIETVRESDSRCFEVDHVSFKQIEGTPFAYWLTERLRGLYSTLEPFESDIRSARQGLATTDDFRFLRAWWEVLPSRLGKEHWAQFARSGGAAHYYGMSPLVINWTSSGVELKALIVQRYGNAGKRIYNEDYYFVPGFCWPLRGNSLSVKAVGPDSVFGIASKMAFVPQEDRKAFLAILNSYPFNELLRIQAGSVGGVQYESGLIARAPVPYLTEVVKTKLEDYATNIWSLLRLLDTRNEISHAFVLPALLQFSGGDRHKEWTSHVEQTNATISTYQELVNTAVFDSYGLLERDKETLYDTSKIVSQLEDGSLDNDSEGLDISDNEIEIESDGTASLNSELISWCVGVAFGRFDCRLATGMREPPLEPKLFDRLPVKSPGMLPDDAEPFHRYEGILVDDQGHHHDLAHLVEEVLTGVEVVVTENVRRWLQRDFFTFHLQQYSRSRRKAPIYWPISTASGNFTLWIYYPSLGSQTGYTAINDFVEPKLIQIGSDVAVLLSKGSKRSRDDEKQLEALQTLELELIELRDTLLKLAPNYKPNHDDGVQISAAPLWPLFRHKPWQKVLKDTWAKLENGDYDWAHLSMNYWPDRVREKCKTDKSLAIAHDLEALYVEPDGKPKKMRTKKN